MEGSTLNGTINNKEDQSFDLNRFMKIVRVLLLVGGLVLELIFIIVCLWTRHLRTNPGRWPQLLTILAAVGALLCDLLESYTNFAKIGELCHIVSPIHFTFKLLVPIGIILTIIDRMARVCSRDPAAPGFRRPLAGALISGLTVGSLVFVAGFLYGTGGVSARAGQKFVYGGPAKVARVNTGRYSCIENRDFIDIYRITEFALVALIGILLVAVSIIMCVKRDGAYAKGKVVPVILGCLAAFLAFMVDMAMVELQNNFWETWMLGVLLLLLIWIFGDAEIRGVFKKTFYPHCFQKE